jgi:hypothetical protein
VVGAPELSNSCVFCVSEPRREKREKQASKQVEREREREREREMHGFVVTKGIREGIISELFCQATQVIHSLMPTISIPLRAR